MGNIDDIIKGLEEDVRKGDVELSLSKISLKYQEKRHTILIETLEAIKQVAKDSKIKQKKSQVSLLLEKRYDKQKEIDTQYIKERDPLLQKITTVINDSNIAKN